MQLHHVDVGFLDDPCDVGSGALLGEIGDRGKVMHHVAERRKLHEQDPRRAHGAF
jgi:hypothetical protein